MTHLERHNPTLTAIAESVSPGRRIHSIGGAYWLGDLQLTYDVENGRKITGMPARAELAETILRRVLAAREQPAWGGRWTRAHRVLQGLRTEVLPTLPRDVYAHWTHESRDDGYLFRSSSITGAAVTLVGEPIVQVRGLTAVEALRELWAKFAPDGELW